MRGSATDVAVPAWETIAADADRRGTPGITRAGDTITWRDHNGRLRGLLAHHGGAITVVVQPAWRRHGIATELLDAAFAQWPIDLDRQQYTHEGLAFAESYESTPRDPT